jgi:hypothetical protein
MLCDRLLLMGRLDEKHAFDRGDVAEVIGELGDEVAFARSEIDQAHGV